MAEEPEAASDRDDDADDGDVIEPDESALGKVYKLARLLVALSNVDVIPASAATAIISAWHHLSAADIRCQSTSLPELWLNRRLGRGCTRHLIKHQLYLEQTAQARLFLGPWREHQHHQDVTSHLSHVYNTSGEARGNNYIGWYPYGPIQEERARLLPHLQSSDGG